MDFPPGSPYADEDHYRDEMIVEWMAGSEAIEDDVIASWIMERATRTPQRRPKLAVPAKPEPEALMLTYKEAARLLSYSEDHFTRHVLPDLRVVGKGRRNAVPRAELVRWIEANQARALKGT